MILDFAAPLPFHNATAPLDVNADGFFTAIDALLVINQLNARSSGPLPGNIGAARSIFGYIDVTGNGSLEPLDILLVINNLNVRGNGEGGAGEASDLSWMDLDGERAERLRMRAGPQMNRAACAKSFRVKASPTAARLIFCSDYRQTSAQSSESCMLVSFFSMLMVLVDLPGAYLVITAM